MEKRSIITFMKNHYVLLWSVVILLMLTDAHGWHRSAARIRKAGEALSHLGSLVQRQRTRR